MGREQNKGVNKRQVGELHVVKKRAMKKQQPTRPEPATCRSLADTLAAEPWSLPASINLFPPYVLVWACSIQSLTH